GPQGILLPGGLGHGPAAPRHPDLAAALRARPALGARRARAGAARRRRARRGRR
ncbi:unnamed protein product, partial [Prorocentrum cordatum]